MMTPSITDQAAVRGAWRPVRRVKSSLSVVITCPILPTVGVHWLAKSSLPCPGTVCPACQSGFPARWYGFVGAAVVQGDGLPVGQRITLELPESIVESVGAYIVRASDGDALLTSVAHLLRSSVRGRVSLLEDLVGLSDPSPASTVCDIWRSLGGLWKIDRLPVADSEVPDWIMYARGVACRRLTTWVKKGGDDASSSHAT
jgi:hypothetical protein